MIPSKLQEPTFKKVNTCRDTLRGSNSASFFLLPSQWGQIFNPFALRTTKTPYSLGRSEGKRVKDRRVDPILEGLVFREGNEKVTKVVSSCKKW